MDALVKLSEGDLHDVHGVVECCSVDSARRRLAQRGVDGVDRVVERGGIGQLAESTADLPEQRTNGAGKAIVLTPRACASASALR